MDMQKKFPPELSAEVTVGRIVSRVKGQERMQKHSDKGGTAAEFVPEPVLFFFGIFVSNWVVPRISRPF